MRCVSCCRKSDIPVLILIYIILNYFLIIDTSYSFLCHFFCAHKIHEMATMANEMRSMDIDWDELQKSYIDIMMTATLNKKKHDETVPTKTVKNDEADDGEEDDDDDQYMKKQEGSVEEEDKSSRRQLKNKGQKKVKMVRGGKSNKGTGTSTSKSSKSSKGSKSASSDKSGKGDKGDKSGKGDKGSKDCKAGKDAKGNKGDCEDMMPSLSPTISVMPTSGPTPDRSNPGTVPVSPPTFPPTPSPTSPPPPSSSLPSLNPTMSSAPSIYIPYRYNRGNCPGAGSSGVPCAENEKLYEKCNKYFPNSSFRACYESCKPSFCCIHDADRTLNYYSPNCNTDENCAQYAYCYIVWWKLHDTIGPAPYIHPAQDDDFFDMTSPDFQRGTVQDTDFYEELLMHHWNDVAIIRNAGKDQNGVFQNSRIFDANVYWELVL